MGLLDVLGLSDFMSKKDARKACQTEGQEAQPRANSACAKAEADSFGAISAEQVWTLQNLYASAQGMCETLDQADVCVSVGQKRRMLSDVFQTDMMRFFLHLVIADGELNPVEAAFMNKILGCNRTVGEWAIVAIRLEVKSMSESHEAPYSLRVMHGVGQGLGISVQDVVVPVFQRLGEALIHVDGQASCEEQGRLSAYMEDIQRALETGETELGAPGYPLELG